MHAVEQFMPIFTGPTNNLPTILYWPTECPYSKEIVVRATHATQVSQFMDSFNELADKKGLLSTKELGTLLRFFMMMIMTMMTMMIMMIMTIMTMIIMTMIMIWL